MMHASVARKKAKSLITGVVVCAGFSLTNAVPVQAGPSPVPGDLRTKAAGNFENAAIWEELTSTGWVAASAAPAATASRIFIYHAVSAQVAGSPTSLTVGSGGTFTISAPTTLTADLTVESGGQLQVQNLLSFASSAAFRVEDGGAVTLNYPFSNPETSIWAGTENFAPSSTFRINAWNQALPILNSDVALTVNTYNNHSAVFGNLILDFGTTTLNGLQVMSASFTKSLAHGLVEVFAAGAGSTLTMGGTGAVIKGNISIAQGFANSTLYLATSQLIVNGSLIQKAGTVFASRGTTAATDLTIKGNLVISGGTFDLSPVNALATATVGVNLAGNLDVATGALLTNSFTSGADGGRVNLNLNGTTPQQIKAFSDVTNVAIRVQAGATAVLGANLKVNRSTISTIVQPGATFNFNGFNFEGTSGFTQMNSATLRITSPFGLDADLGNVQSSLNGRKFDKDGIYHFSGTVPQITGTGLNPASGQKSIIADNPTSVTLSHPVSISTTGGAVDIRQGALVETATGFIAITNSSNSVQLKMAANTVYRTAALATSYNTHNSFPQAGGTWTLDPTSTLELNGNGAQILRSSSTSKVYSNLIFSNSGTKTLANSVSNVAGTVTIKDLVTLDARENALGGTTTNFTMTGGRFRTSRTNSTLPTMGGIYSITGGVVELYGTLQDGQTQTLRAAKTYHSVEINATSANPSTYNVLHGSGAITISGEFRVNAPAVYQIAGSNNYILGTTANSGSFLLEAGATLKYGNSAGITLQSCGTTASCGNIRTPFRTFPSDASYGVIGTATNMVTGTGLPSTVANFYLDRGNTSLVTLTNPLTIANTLVFKNGKLKTTDAALLTFAGHAEQLGSSAASYVSGPVAKAGTDAFIFPIGNDSYFAPAGISEAADHNLIMAKYAFQNPNTVASTANLAAPIWALQPQEFWQITRKEGSSPVSVSLSWNETRSGAVADLNHLVVARLSNPTTWTSLGSSNLVTEFPNTFLHTANSIQNLGYFALAVAEIPNGMTPLPIELISFTVQEKNGQALLNWVTAFEHDNAYFEIERSTDGRTFGAIAQIASQGNANFRQFYQYLDPVAIATESYYRLRQTDLDGTSTISHVIRVGGEQGHDPVVSVFPNPTNGLVILQANNLPSDFALARILDLNGRTLKEQAIVATSGLAESRIATDQLKPGFYLLELVTEKSRKAIRFQKF